MKYLILRLDAPLISFGAPAIDRHGVIQPYPALSMLTGLIGNALGYDHTDSHKLERMQDRLRYAVREDRIGRQIKDYQTVDLSQSFMRDGAAWTTRGYIEKRKGGTASTGTHERYRYYWADGVYTVAMTMVPFDEVPTLDDLEQKLQYPERPLFIGRKTCLPSSPLLVETQEREDIMEAIQSAGYSRRADRHATYKVWWQADHTELTQTEKYSITPAVDRRDWINQIHVGERWIAEGIISANKNVEGDNDESTH